MATLKKTPKEIALDNAKNNQEHKLRHYIWLHDVRSAHNVGSIFRIADAMGIKQVILSGFTPTPPLEKISKTALGAEEAVSWIYYQKASEVIKALTSQSIQLIALEQTKTSVSLNAFTPSEESFCLVAGSETIGVSDEILRASLQHVHIDQYGVKHSLNVSVATGIALFVLTQLHSSESQK